MDQSFQHTWINIHTHHKPRIEGELAIRNAGLLLTPEQLANLKYPVSAGLHPWDIQRMSLDVCSEKLKDCVMLPSVLAVGEIGLDRSIDIPYAEQVRYFETQLLIAKAVQKPVILHAVRSYSDLIPYLKKSKIPFIFHQFSGNLQQARELIKHNAFVSFGKNLFEPKTESVFMELPLEQIFLETDTARHINITDLYRKAAELKKITVESLTQIQLDTFTRIFKTR